MVSFASPVIASSYTCKGPKLGLVLPFAWSAAMAEERVRTAILVRYTTMPVEAVIYTEEGVEVKDPAVFAAQQLCPIFKREPVAFPVRYVIQCPQVLPDRVSFVSDESRKVV